MTDRHDGLTQGLETGIAAEDARGTACRGWTRAVPAQADLGKPSWRTTSMTNEHVKGVLNTTRGKVEEGLGKVTRNKGQQVRGNARQAQGHAQQVLGDVEDALRTPKKNP